MSSPSETAISMEPFVRGIPKCELHVHAEGTMTPALKIELAARNKIDIGADTPAEIEASYKTIRDTDSFLRAYYEGIKLLQTERDFYELAFQYFETVAAENVRYVELFFDPQAHTARGIRFETLIRGIREAQRKAERLGVRSQLIMCFLRDWQVEFAFATLTESLQYRDWIVGVGLDSDSRGHPPGPFRPVFDRARAEGLMVTAHCDFNFPEAVDHLWEALDVIGVDRVDHGVEAPQDPAVLEELVRRQTPMTLCPIAYKKVTYGNVVDGIGKEAEIRALRDAGAAITINSDDPGYYAGHLTANLLATQEALGLTEQDIIELQRAAFNAAWIEATERQRYLDELDAYARRRPGQARARG